MNSNAVICMTGLAAPDALAAFAFHETDRFSADGVKKGANFLGDAFAGRATLYPLRNGWRCLLLILPALFHCQVPVLEIRRTHKLRSEHRFLTTSKFSCGR